MLTGVDENEQGVSSIRYIYSKYVCYIFVCYPDLNRSNCSHAHELWDACVCVRVWIGFIITHPHTHHTDRTHSMCSQYVDIIDNMDF